MKNLSVILLFLSFLCINSAFGLEKIVLPESETGSLNLSFAQGYNFDPLKDTPNLPENLMITAYEGKWGYYIIQFPGPIKTVWRKEIERRGGKFLDYINRYAYLVRLPNAKFEAVSALPQVRWLGLYQPAYKIFPYLEKTPGIKSLIVVFFYDCNENEVLRKLENLGATNIVTEFNWVNKSVKIDIDGTMIDEIARIPEVYWIEYFFPITPDNVNVQWVDQKGYAGVADTSRPIWRKGIIGDGIIVSITDEPMWMGHDLYRDPAVPNPGPTHRKVIAYTGTISSASHGTHTTGTLCGDDSAVGGTSLNDGLAKHARVYFQNYSQFTGWDMNTWLIGPYNGVGNLKARNHSMSLSRKDSFSDYVWTDRTLDQFVWAHRDFMHCNSMGNYNLAPTMGHPPVAKDLISVGSCQNGTSCQTLSTFTSIGPANDGRRKPTLVSVGGSVYSASTAGASSYVSSSGTSMATPNMTAATALIRQYFREGWYPSGTKTPSDSILPSAALIKTTAIVGADNSINYAVPSNYVGWGRLDLDSSLYFAGDNKKLWIVDDTIGLNTNDSVIYQIQIDNSTIPFRVSLVWTDYPGTPYSYPILINNLNLTVTSPTGTEYKGSVYSSGQSTTGGNYDSLNVEECTRINTPAIGLWKIKVKAKNVPFGPQPFALAATYGIASQFHDVGVVAITAPIGNFDSTQTVVPACSVYNYGNTTENYSVRMKIGSLYNRTASVSAHLAGTSQYATFPVCTLYQRGTNAVTCSTELSGDMLTTNDKMTGSILVRVLDVATTAILSPPAVVDSGQTITPSARVKNLGNVVANNIPVRFDIGAWQHDTTIAVLNPNESTVVNFANWTATQRGNFSIKCSTRLVSDLNKGNDRQIGSVLVRVLDVGTTAILSPPAVVDSGQTISPQARVRNFGNTTVNNIPVRFNIGTWQDDTTITSLAADESTIVTFASWTATQRGNFTTQCSTRLTGDMYNNNDKQTGSVAVGVRDVGIIALLLPDTVNTGTNVTPACSLFNYGTVSENYNAIMKFNSANPETIAISSHLPASYLYVVFSARTILSGPNTFACSLAINDMNPTNDTITKIVFGQSYSSDVGVTKIILSDTLVYSGTSVALACSVYNYGNSNLTYPVRMKIGTVYDEDIIILNHAPASYQFITFPNWTAVAGTFNVSCSTELAGDTNPANDKQTDEIMVLPPISGNWEMQTLIPTGLSTKRPKAGSCIAGLEATGKIYLLKASNTQDFGIFTPDAGVGTWTSDTIPLGTKAAGDGKRPKKGASIAAYETGKCLFALRGANTPGFWKYQADTANGQVIGWNKMTNIPVGLKNPKDASGLVAVPINGADYIFAMKGSRTDEFYLYNIEEDSWVKVNPPPAGRSGRIGYKKGSCLTYDSDSLVYVLKGNYGDFFKYNLYTHIWYQLYPYDARLSPNREGKKKKPKDGAGLVYHDGAVYMLKGGNTNEFWKYDIVANNWLQMGPSIAWDIPLMSSKKVKGGGCLTKLGGYFYVAKGANTPEFYRHILPTAKATKVILSSEGEMAEKIASSEIKLSIIPNPAFQVAMIKYRLPNPEKLSLKIFNSTGTLIKSYTNSAFTIEGNFILNTKELPSGIYILRFNSAGLSVSRKLVIEK